MWTDVAAGKVRGPGTPEKGTPAMHKTLALVFAFGGVLVAVGVIVLINSTHFNPNPFMENESNAIGQVSGVVVASTGVLVAAIGAAAMAICRSIETAREAA